MNRLFALVSACTLLLTLASCSEKKPPEVAAYQGKKVLDIVRTLAKEYQDKDLGGFMDEIAKNYPDRGAFETSIKAVFTRYDSIRMTVHNTKMLVLVPDRGNIKAEVNWDAEWRTSAGGMIKDGGRVTLVLDAKDFLLVAIEGKNPFLPVEKPR